MSKIPTPQGNKSFAALAYAMTITGAMFNGTLALPRDKDFDPICVDKERINKRSLAQKMTKRRKQRLRRKP
jgi:hypothetical protein